MSIRTACAALACAALVASGARAADNYPTRPVKILFGFPPASATDFIARTVGEKLGQRWGQPVVIDNRPGAGGNLGSAIAAKEPKDGYTVFFGTVANAISTTFYSKLDYDYLRDFTPVTLVATTPLVLVVSKDLPVKSVKELIEYAKAHPGEVNFGSGGPGTSNQAPVRARCALWMTESASGRSAKISFSETGGYLRFSRVFGPDSSYFWSMRLVTNWS